MKVLHLPIIICDQPSEITLALNRAGVKADYAVLDTNGQEWLLAHNNIKYNLHTTDLVKNDPDMRLLRKTLYKFFLQAIREYDIFHFHSNISLFSQWFGHFKDLEILKKAGKKIVVSYWGCDIRTKSGNSKYKYNTCLTCKAACDDEKKIFSRDTFTKYADLTIAHMPELYEYAPAGSIHLPSFIDTDYWKRSHRNKSKSETFKIFHPFGNSALRGDVRGTEMIKKAVDHLNKEGFNIEFLFFDKVPHSQMRKYYEKADLVIEQLKYGTYGLTSLEAMALEIPVMGYIRDKYKKYFQEKIPIIDANPSTITDVLRETIKNKKALNKIGKRGREFVVKYHDSKKVVNRLISYYEKISKDKDKKIVSFEKISIEARKAIGFKISLLMANYSTNNLKATKTIELLKKNGYRASAIANIWPYQDSHPGSLNSNIVQFFGEIAPRWFRYFDFMKNFATYIIIAENTSKTPPIGLFKRIAIKILYPFFYIRYWVLMNHGLYSLAMLRLPDIVHAVNKETLLAGFMVKKECKSQLIYERDRETTALIRPPKTFIPLFKLLEKILIKNADVVIESFAKNPKNKLLCNVPKGELNKTINIYNKLLRR